MSKKKPPAKKPARPKAVTVYAVQRVVFGYDGPTHAEPERVFASEAAARKFARERALACRPISNPFWPGYQPAITGGETKLAQVVRKLGLKPPVRGKNTLGNVWAVWWDRTYFEMSDTQRDAIWNALDKLELYKVVKTKLEG